MMNSQTTKESNFRVSFCLHRQGAGGRDTVLSKRDEAIPENVAKNKAMVVGRESDGEGREVLRPLSVCVASGEMEVCDTMRK